MKTERMHFLECFQRCSLKHLWRTTGLQRESGQLGTFGDTAWQY